MAVAVRADALRPGDVVLRPALGEAWAAGPLTVAGVDVEATFAVISWVEPVRQARVPMTTEFDVEESA